MAYNLPATTNPYHQPFVNPTELYVPIPQPPLLFWVPPYYFMEQKEDWTAPQCYGQPVPDSVSVPGLWTPEVLAIWPEPWKNYKNLGELCGEIDNLKNVPDIHHNHVKSIVCRCSKTENKFSSSQMKCFAHDPYIPPSLGVGDWHRYIEVVKNLEMYCIDRCDCAESDDEKKTRERVRLREDKAADIPDPKRPKNGDGAGFWDFGSYDDKDRSDDTQFYDDWTYGAYGNECPIESTCSSFAGCSQVRKTRGCQKSVCQVKPTSRDKNFALGLCKNLVSTVSAGLGGRKRRRRRNVNNEEEAFPCACNSSYVSNACCSSDTGLVWEHPDLLLGQLLLEDDDGDSERRDGKS